MKTCLAILTLLLLPLAVQAEGLGFKGAELGSPLARIASDPRHACRAVNTPIGDTICSLRSGEVETIAGAAVASLFYFYDASHLSGIQVTIAEKDFQRVVDALAAKYGAGSLVTERVKNLKGEAHENRTWRWKYPEGSLEAQRYAGRLDKSVIRYSDDQAAERVRQRRAAAARDPKQDL